MSTPIAGGARFDLRGIDDVLIGRGAARDARVEESGGARTLSVNVPDPRMSSRHARLARLAGGWVLSDLGSKNGTRLATRTIDRAVVVPPGALLELGETAFMLLPSPGDGRHVLGIASREEGFATLLPSLEAELDRVATIAASRTPVLVLGESGTGKELVARAVHRLSERKGRFVAINCGALPGALVEAELFGHRRGAFSGATEDRPGLVRAADRGTLFLDEIGDLGASSQAALLRVLQEGEVLPVGETSPSRVDVRIVAATHHDLEARAQEGSFRGDLLARLDGHQIRLPPLRERRADLGAIVAALIRRLAPERADQIRLAPDAGRALLAHDWPRNVRELEQALGAALALAKDGVIAAEHLPARLRLPGGPACAAAAPPRPGLSSADEALRDQLMALFEQHRGNLTAVARALGKDRTQVRRWLTRLGLSPERWR